MNLTDCTVTEITGEPFAEYDHWWLPVKYVSMGATESGVIMCEDLEEAKRIIVGHKFLR